jgi:hypothetical protein
MFYVECDEPIRQFRGWGMFLTILEFNILDIPKSQGRILAVCHGRKRSCDAEFYDKAWFYKWFSDKADATRRT